MVNGALDLAIKSMIPVSRKAAVGKIGDMCFVCIKTRPRLICAFSFGDFKRVYTIYFFVDYPHIDGLGNGVF